MLNGGEKTVIITSWDLGPGFPEIRDAREKSQREKRG